jgi:hypothetical protein
MTDCITIDSTKNFEQNLQMNGIPNEQYIIGELYQMTLRSGKTYPTPGPQSGGALHPMAKAILIGAFGTLAAGTVLGTSYAYFASHLCVPGTWAHVIQFVPVYGAPQAAICSAAQTQFTVAITMAIGIAGDIMRRTNNAVKNCFLTQQEEATLNKAAADLNTNVPAAVAAADPATAQSHGAAASGRAGGSSFFKKQQRRSRQKNSRRRQQRRSRQKY